MPTVSVVVPVYKVEPYLQRCVDSILGQSYDDLELILVDDGSPDNCGAICDAYAQKDGRVHVIHQENGGLSAARNAGIDWVFANSDSEWITFIDSDDWVHREYLQAMLHAAQKFGVNQVMCDLLSTDSFVSDGDLPEGYAAQMSAQQAYISHYGMCMTACGKILHRSLLEEIRFPIGKIHEDAYVTHIITFASQTVAICDVPLYYYFSNPGSITRVKWSEKRLEEFEAHEIRLSYLQAQGLTEAYAAELEAYTFLLFAQVQDLRILSKEDGGYRKHLAPLRSRAIGVFREARKHGLFPYKEENVWIYELVYPAKPIWIARKILKMILK